MRRSLLAVVAVVVGALALSACLPATAPENGRLADTSLTTISPSCRIVNEVAPRLQQMLADAKRDGFALAPESKSFSIVAPPTLESCYRSYDGQVWWRDYYCFFGQCQLAAVPGTSVHGWGRAVDFECAGNEMTFGDPCYTWLALWARNYGFVHPAWAEPGQPSAEAWHWEAQ
ncbi:MAG: M15 family metallopeptidase [Acidimicrobiia bacterium]